MKKDFLFLVVIAFVAIYGWSPNNNNLINKCIVKIPPVINVPPVKVWSDKSEQFMLKTETLALEIQQETTA